MGAEIRCRAQFGKQSSEGKALLETNEIIFRGDFRLKIPLHEITSVKAVKGELRVRFPEGVAIFHLGFAAEKWADKMLHPKTVIEKLGVKPGGKAVLLGITDSAFLQDARARMECSEKLRRNCEMIFFQANTAADLKRVPTLARALAPAGALWIVYPKGQIAIRETDVIAAGRKAGLKDVKVVGFSSTHTALKFVIPLSRR